MENSRINRAPLYRGNNYINSHERSHGRSYGNGYGDRGRDGDREGGRNGGRSYQSPYSSGNKNYGQSENPDQPVRNTALSSTIKNENQPPPPLRPGVTRVIPISGQGEIGRYCWYFEQDNEIVVVDCGMGYVPHGMKGGIDRVLPNIDYLKENKDNIRALVVSGSHEESAGDLLNFIKELEIKEVFLPGILIELYRENFPADLKINKLENTKKYSIGQRFKITSFSAAFSTVDSFSLLIETPGMRIFYNGSSKIDHSPPIYSCRTEIAEIARQVASLGVDLLIGNSINVETGGYTQSESSVIKGLDNLYSQAQGRLIVLTGCNFIHRIKILTDLAQKHIKKVCFIGESTLNWVKAAQKVGYLNFAENLIIQVSDLTAGKLKPNEIVCIVGDLEGNIMNPFLDLAYKRHPQIELTEGDTIIVSANPPLGTTRLLANAIDQLFVQGVNVVGGKDSGVHVGGFASKEELKFMYNLTRPTYFLPSQGENRQLILHAEMLGICGVNPKNVVIVDNGNVIDLDKSLGRAEIVGRIPTQPVFFSNSLDGSLDKQSLDERRSLSSDGTLVAALVVDFAKSKLLARPVLKAFGSGFTMKAGWTEIEETIISDIEFAVAKALQNGHTDIGIVRHVTHDVLNKRLRERFGMSKPVLSIVVQELKQQEVKV